MATSGSVNYSVTAGDIITEALELLGVLYEGETASTNQNTSSMRTLNMMVKAWQADGLNLFAVDEFYLFPQLSQREYTLNSSTSDHVTNTYYETALSANALSGASTISVDSDDNITDGDYIGIYLDDGTMHWTTVNGTPSGDTVSLDDNLTAAASTDAVVYNYTTKANRPMKLLECYNKYWASGDDSDIQIDVISRDEYNTLSTKQADGKINLVYYDPQVSSPILHVYPEADDERDILVLVVQRTLEDFDATTDNPDYPQEWYLPLAYNLALELAPKYGIPTPDYQKLAMRAAYYYQLARDFDNEAPTSWYLQPAINH